MEFTTELALRMAPWKIFRLAGLTPDPWQHDLLASKAVGCSCSALGNSASRPLSRVRRSESSLPDCRKSHPALIPHGATEF